MLLAVETSGSLGSVAISDGETLIAERILLEGGARHAQTMVSEVDGLLRELGLPASDIRSVAVSIGPGSFTGLRVGLVFAKTFAWLNQANLVAVDTLQAIAQQAPTELDTVTSVIDAQRGEMFAGTYRIDPASGLRCRVNEVHVTTQQALSTKFPLTGPGLLRILPEFASVHCLLDASIWQPKAATVALLGNHMVRQQHFAIPETLEPVYIRASYAEEKRQA